jgi:hypothetical protein
MTVTVSIYKSNQFVPFVGRSGKLCFKPEDRTLEFVKDIQCVKRGRQATLPSMDLSHEPDGDGNPTAIYVFAEHIAGGRPQYLATMHFEIDELDATKVQACVYNDMGQEVRIRDWIH